MYKAALACALLAAASAQNANVTAPLANVTAPPVANVTAPAIIPADIAPPAANVTAPPAANVTAPPAANVTAPPAANATALPVAAPAMTPADMAPPALVPAATLDDAQLENLMDQFEVALDPLLNLEDAFGSFGDSSYIDINNFEWILTEFDNEYVLTVGQLPRYVNNLEPNLAIAIANTGNVLQNNADDVATLILSETGSIGTGDDQGIMTQELRQYGAYLTENAAEIAKNDTETYQNSARAFATNENGVLTQFNQLINGYVQGNENIDPQEAIVNAGLGNSLINNVNLPESATNATLNTNLINDYIQNNQENLPAAATNATLTESLINAV